MKAPQRAVDAAGGQPLNAADWLHSQTGREHTSARSLVLTLVLVNLAVGGILAVAALQSAAQPPVSSAAQTWGMAAFLWAVILGPIDGWLAVQYIRTRRLLEQGSIQLANGQTYDYVMGDTLVWYGGTGQHNRHIALPFARATGLSFDEIPRHGRGLSVHLPVVLPHIYLDTRQDTGRLTPYLVAPAQRVDLEGGFARTFKMYMPRGAQIEVLSLLQPNVMELLQQSAGAYDIEMYRDTLRIISRRPVYGRSHLERQRELLALAKALLQAMQPKINYWQRQPFGALPDLTIYRYRGVTLGRYYVPLAGVWWLVLLLAPGFAWAIISISNLSGIWADRQTVMALVLLFGCLVSVPAGLMLYVTLRRSRVTS